MRARRRAGFAAATSIAVIVALASVGAMSYAANAVRHAVSTATHATKLAKGNGVRIVDSATAGGDQYRPGYGFGDPNHNHDGPPGLTGKGEKTPPAQTRTEGTKERVVTRVRVDEQAALYISVLDSSGNRVVLNQDGSKVGGDVSGKQVKTLHYVVLVPRSIPISLLIPKNQLHKGETYTVHIIAVDKDGNKTTLDIPFVA